MQASKPNFSLLGMLALLWLVLPMAGQAQDAAASGIKVPEQIKFAGIKLDLNEDARNAVQKKVNGLLKSQKFYDEYVRRCNMYFPLIEEAFAEADLPREFCFLALQESALLPDAISRSNAVGFWQFKQETANEMGLQTNKDLDERKNIVAASVAAARYLKRNNVYLKNWVYSLLSYNLGLTGANNLSDRSKIGADKMELDSTTHIYIIHFLAHKVAFENAVGRSTDPKDTKLIVYKDAGGKTWEEISKLSGVEVEQLKLFNRWLMADKVPAGKAFNFIIPVPASKEREMREKLGKSAGDVIADNAGGNSGGKPATGTPVKPNTEYPKIASKRTRKVGDQNITQATVNGIPAVITDDNTNLPALLSALEVSRNKFMRYNDMSITSEVQSNQVYYLKKKRSKSEADYHVTMYDESLWQIAQKYAVKEKALRKKNRMNATEEPEPGRVLWLKKTRPSKVSIEIRDIGPKPEKKEEPASGVVKEDDPRLKEILEIEDPKDVPQAPEVILTDGKFHVVKRGETLFAISRAYKISTLRLKEMNKLGEDLALKEGQILIVREDVVEASPVTPANTGADANNPLDSDVVRIDSNGNIITGDATAKGADPASKPTADPATAANAKVHVVQPGESVYAVGRTYSVNYQDILKWNSLEPGTIIPVGARLYVSDPQGAAPLPVDRGTGSQLNPNVGGAVASTPFRDIKKHTVMPKETLYGISRAENVSVANLIAWNNLSESNPLSVGQTLTVEDPQEYQKLAKAHADAQKAQGAVFRPKPVVHEVKVNESLDQIAFAYGTTVEEIRRLNNLTPNDVLVEKQLLVVKDPNAPAAGAQPGPSGKANTMDPGTTINARSISPVLNSGAGNAAIATTPGNKPKIHVVKRGDTVFSLSRAYNITPEQLRAWNNITDNNLKLNQQLIVGYETVVVEEKKPAPTATGDAGAVIPKADTPVIPNVTGTPVVGTQVDAGPKISKAVSTNQGNYIGQDPVVTPPVVNPAVADPVKQPVSEPVAKQPEKPKEVFHTVTKGETLFSISRKYNVSVNDLKILNNGVTTLKVGQKLKIK